ncbi:MAG: VIT1/CCC1 transporter family protein [Ornithinimicrobium sp.]
MSVETPTSGEINRWKRHLADERAVAGVLRRLASTSSTRTDAEVLAELAGAEDRHAAHWEELLGTGSSRPASPPIRYRFLGWLAGTPASDVVLILLQRAEDSSAYAKEPAAPPQMAADEVVHVEVLRALAARGRERLSGNFRAAVFGANDGLVSNLALVAGMSATGVSGSIVLAAGAAGLLAGAMSMGAGEYISVRSARELLEASAPRNEEAIASGHLDLDVNELALVFRARGASPESAQERADRIVVDARAKDDASGVGPLVPEVDYRAVGSPWGAASSSFAFFASGALVPILPYLFGASPTVALVVAIALVGLSLMMTGAVVGLLSGASMWSRALRQLTIGFGAAAVTYLLGWVFGATGVG